MTLIIDSVTPDQACLETAPTSADRDRCVVEASFHLQREDHGSATTERHSETIPFHREAGTTGANFFIQASSLPAGLSSLITEHRFDPAQTALLRDLRNIVYVRTDYDRGRALLVDFDRAQRTEYARLFDDLVNYIFLGEIVSPDPIQQDSNRSLIARLAAAPESVQDHLRIVTESFLLDNREWLRREDDTALPRVERLAFILNFCRRVRESLRGLPAASSLQGRVSALQGEIISHLFMGEPTLAVVQGHLMTLALDLYRQPPAGHYNLFEILAPALEALGQNTPFQSPGEPRTRLQRFIYLVHQPSQTRTLEYSLLEPRAALERSLVDSLSEDSSREAVVRTVSDLVRPPDFSTDWLGENGRLREILGAVLPAVRVEEREGESLRLRMDPTVLRARLETLLAQHSIQHREYVAGSLAAIRSLTGRGALQVFWDGQMRSVSWNLSIEDRAALRSIDRWLATQVRSSLEQTDLLLPILEGAVCAAGAGLLTWGLLDNPRAATVSPQVVAGAGTIGLGCGALGTHFLIDTRNPYISDLIGGGISALLGVGIPLLIYFLGGAFSSNPMTPMDGRNPVEGFGP